MYLCENGEFQIFHKMDYSLLSLFFCRCRVINYIKDKSGVFSYIKLLFTVFLSRISQNVYFAAKKSVKIIWTDYHTRRRNSNNSMSKEESKYFYFALREGTRKLKVEARYLYFLFSSPVFPKNTRIRERRKSQLQISIVFPMNISFREEKNIHL